MLFKLLIVDDEATIRAGLATTIDWRSLGVELVGEAANGKDGLQKAIALNADIVIADIRMPLMSGIEMGEQIVAQRPTTKIIILSGYDDFEYARGALKLGAFDYLLKPVADTDLEQVVGRATAGLMAERHKQEDYDRAKRYMTESLPRIKYRLLQDYFSGELAQDKFLEQFPLGNGVNYQIILAEYSQVAELHRELEVLRFALGNTAVEFLGRICQPTVCFSESNRVVIVAVYQYEPRKEAIVAICHELQDTMFHLFGQPITIGVGLCVTSVQDLGLSFQSAETAINNKFYTGLNETYTYSSTGSKRVNLVVLQSDEEQTLRTKLHTFGDGQYAIYLDNLLDKYLRRNYTKQALQNFCSSLIWILIQESSLYLRSNQQATTELGVNIDQIETMSTIQEMRQWVIKTYRDVMNKLQSDTGKLTNTIVKDGIQYAQTHFAEKLTVAAVADSVYVTPNYFSKVFKESTGENFTEWLNKYRINGAIQQMQLHREKKIYQIATECGFQDYKYFTFLFKKYVGTAPTTYKKTL